MGESVNKSRKIVLKNISKSSTFFDVVDGLRSTGEM